MGDLFEALSKLSGRLAFQLQKGEQLTQAPRRHPSMVERLETPFVNASRVMREGIQEFPKGSIRAFCAVHTGSLIVTNM
jgi:hypothetical protein